MSREHVRFSINTEVQFAEEGRTFTGLIPYEVFGQFNGEFKPRLVQGCFSKSLIDGRDIWAIFNHDWEKPLARLSKGTLKLNDTDSGLEIVFSVPETTWGNDLIASYKAGNIGGYSFGGYIDASEDNSKAKERDITDFDLFEISPCYEPVFDKGGEISLHSVEHEEEVPVVPTPWKLLEAIQKLSELKN